jgi:nucleoside-diphosphate-sugar epimerase
MGTRTVVFGGSGKVGRVILNHLAQQGYDLLNVDLKTGDDTPDIQTVVADARDLGQVYSLLSGAEAVVQLAAYPTAGIWPEDVIFRTNTQITYNLLEAASNYAIPRVVCFSTMAVIYYPKPSWFPFEPHYFPVDETHPVSHHNAYSLSKQVGELAADMFSRLGRTVPVSLRPAWITTPEEIHAKRLLEDLDEGLQGVWSYIDVRDIARACQAALEADLTRHEVFNLTAPDTFAPIPTLELIHRNWPQLSDLRENLDGYRPLIDARKAARLLGFTPIYSARQG